MFKVGFFQFAPKFGAVAENLATVRAALDRVKADVLVLPELAFSGYLFESRAELAALAEDPRESETVAGLTALCRENDFYIVTGLAEKKADKIFNSALVIGGRGLVHTYRKLHLFNTEKEYFDPGNKPLETITIRGVKIGVMVCFDWAFPEVARVLALQGADVLCHPSNLVLTYCQQTMLARAIENSVFAVTANRFGADARPRGTVTFTGQSQVATPGGELLYRAPGDSQEVFVADIDVGQAQDKSMTPRNDLLGDRRPEYYANLTMTSEKELAP